MDPYLASHVQIDAVVTVVDGSRGPDLLNDGELSPLLHHQVAIADVVVVTRRDQAPEEAISMMVNWARRQAPMAKIHAVARGDMPPEDLVGIRAHDLQSGLPARETCSHGHTHAAGIGNETLVFDTPLDPRLVDRTLCDLLRDHGHDLLRCKGIVHLAGEPERWIFQGAGPLFATGTGKAWQPGESRTSRLVFIGRQLDRMNLHARFTATQADAST